MICPLDPDVEFQAGHCECWSELGDPCCFCGRTEDEDIPYSCCGASLDDDAREVAP